MRLKTPLVSISRLAAFALSGASALCFAQGVAGTISTVAGNGSLGFSGDGGPATSAPLFSPSGLASDNLGNLFIVEWQQGIFRRWRRRDQRLVRPVI